MAMAAVPECGFRATGDHGFAALDCARCWSVSLCCWCWVSSGIEFSLRGGRRPRISVRCLTASRAELGYEGTDEYVPVGADPYEIKQDAPRVALIEGGDATDQVQRIQIQRWNAESKVFTAEVSQPGTTGVAVIQLSRMAHRSEWPGRRNHHARCHRTDVDPSSNGREPCTDHVYANLG